MARGSVVVSGGAQGHAEPQMKGFRTMSAPIVSGIRVSAYYEVSVIRPDEDGSTLRMLNAAVGGYVDVVSLPEGIDMWVGDDALIRGCEINGVASHVVRVLGGAGTISGPVVFATSTSEGETVALSADQVRTLAEWVPILLRGDVLDLLTESDYWSPVVVDTGSIAADTEDRGRHQ